MRKNFFKKLSFGMALALVLGTTAHAGVAQAAEEAVWTLKKNSVTVYLNESNVQGTPDTFDFNFKNKPEGWKNDYAFEWRSADPTIAVVGAAGKGQGVSVGTTTITCYITEKDGGKFVDAVDAKVTVKANAADVKITNAEKYDAEKGVTVYTGEVIDLNRAMYDHNGNKTTKRGVYVTDYTRWYVLDAEGNPVGDDVATVTQTNGQFVIHKPGIYGLVCETYQSDKNDQAIVNDFVMVNVEEAKPVIDAEQKTVTKFELDLATPITEATLKDEKLKEAFMDNLDVVMDYKGDDKYVLPIRNVEATKGFVSKDGLVSRVTVTMWDNFIDGKEYTVGLKAEKDALKDTLVDYIATDSFTATVGKPSRIEIDIVNPMISLKETVDDVVYVTDKVDHQNFTLTFYNAKGIELNEILLDGTDLITDGELTLDVIPKSGNDEDRYYVEASINDFTIEAEEGGEGKKYTLVVKYSEYDSKKGDYVEVAPGAKEFTVEAEPKANKLSSNIAIIKSSSAPSYRGEFDRVNVAKIAANDTGLYVAASVIDDWGVKYDNNSGSLRFYSSNPQVAEVDLYDGQFTPYEVGSVRINVYLADDVTGEEKFVGYTSTKILAERAPKTIKINGKASQELYSHVLVNATKELMAADYDAWTTELDDETVTFYVQVFDNHGEEMTGLKADDFVLVDDTDKYFSNVGSHVTSGGVSYGYPIKVENDDADVVTAITAVENNSYKRSSVSISGVVALSINEKETQKLTVTLRKPIDEKVVKYDVELDVPGAKDVTTVSTGMKSGDYAATVRVMGLCENGVPVYVFDNSEVFYATTENADGDIVPTDIKTVVDDMNKLSETEKADIASSGALVYTITKNGKLVKANGENTPKVASGATITSISGQTMRVEDELTIKFNDTFDFEGKDVTYTNATGTYVITLYKITGTTKDNKTTLKSVKVDTADMVVDASQSTLKAYAEHITTGIKLYDDLNKKLTWTDNVNVKDAIIECFKIQLGGADKYADTYVVEELYMIYNVRINADTMYVKSIKAFVPAGDDFVAVECPVGLTLLITE